MSKCRIVMESRRCVQLRIDSFIDVISVLYPPHTPCWSTMHALWCADV